MATEKSAQEKSEFFYKRDFSIAKCASLWLHCATMKTRRFKRASKPDDFRLRCSIDWKARLFKVAVYAGYDAADIVRQGTSELLDKLEQRTRTNVIG